MSKRVLGSHGGSFISRMVFAMAVFTTTLQHRERKVIYYMHTRMQEA